MSGINEDAIESAFGPDVQKWSSWRDALPGLPIAIAHQFAGVAEPGEAPFFQETQIQVAIVKRRYATVPLEEPARITLRRIVENHYSFRPVQQILAGAHRGIARTLASGALVEPPSTVAMVARHHQII